MAARASLRIAIAWSGAEAIEDTDTLVLTIDGYSLDLRVFVEGPAKGTIDWSTVAHVKEIEGSTAKNPILRWDHIIDSRPPTDLPDQGVFDTLSNGDVTEMGTMYNPKTKLYEPYVETWRRLPQTTGAPFLVLKLDVSAVVDGSAGVAFLGRVGPHALGIAKVDDGRFYAWRDRLVDESWRRVYSFGDDSLPSWLPSLPTTTPEAWVKGSTATLGGANWTVETTGTI